MERVQSAEEVLKSRSGVSKDFVTLFLAMCQAGGVRARSLEGFARSRDFR